MDDDAVTLPDSTASSGPEEGAWEGTSRYHVAPDRRSQAAEQRNLRRDLSSATSNGRFLLYFQPRVPLRSGKPRYAEAVLRWPHRKRGLMSPASFMPIAEQTGHVAEIGGWTLREACREAATWPGRLGVSVNVSGRQLTEGLIANQVAAALSESGLDADRLELELREALLTEVDIETLLTLSALRDLGVGVAIDEFGATIGSVIALKRLPLTGIKLDRGLVRNLPDGSEDAGIARGVIGLAHALGLVVTAEGVETVAQRAFLSRAGCDEGQGNLFSQPLPGSKLAEFSEARPPAA